MGRQATDQYRQVRHFEPLEPRLLLCSADPLHGDDLLQAPTPQPTAESVQSLQHARPRRTRIPPNINVSRMRGSQTEGTVAVNPRNTQHLFIASNREVNGLFSAVSHDGGQTWSQQIVGDGSDDLPAACCDPSAAFDAHGNLYLTYVDARTDRIQVVMSTDGGFTFRPMATFAGSIDQPTIATGQDMVWITFQFAGRIAAAGAAVNGPGDVEPFQRLQRVRSGQGSNFGDIAIGPDGQVMLTYISPSFTPGPAGIYINVDPDGLGPRPFGRARRVTFTNVGGFRFIPAQSVAKIDAEPGLAYDRSNGPARGRAYLVYTDATTPSSIDTYTVLRFSENNGRTWSQPIRVSPSPTLTSQFLPRIALDQTTGNIAITWYDTRDVGITSARFFGATGQPDEAGLQLSSDFQISRGISNANLSGNSIDYGDYNGLAFAAGVIYPIWSDNSNSTRDNPDGALSSFDLYTTSIRAA